MGKKNTLLTRMIKAVAFMFTVYYGCVRYFFNFAFARIRRVPFRRRIKKYRMTDKALKERIAYGEFRDKGKEWFDSTPYKVVSIRSKDGLKLIGYYFHNPDAKRIILCAHGYRSTGREDFGNLGKYFFEHDASLLIIDQRAHGKSEGRYITFGISESEDIISWLDWILVNITEKLPIYLSGISMGGATVLYASEKIRSRRVKGIIADCAFSSPEEIFSCVLRNKCMMLLKLLFRGMNLRAFRKAGFSFVGSSATDSVRNTRFPILFIHGTEDDLVPVQMTINNYMATNAPKRLLLVKGAGHAMSYMKDSRKYEEALKSFFETYDTL